MFHVCHWVVPAIAVRCVLAAPTDPVAHCIVHSTGHLANAEPRAEHGDAKVVDRIFVHLHDGLQAHTPPHEEAEGADVDGEPGAAAPAPQGLPERAHSTDSIGVGDPDHWATESLKANPTIIVAAEDAVGEIGCACILVQLFVQPASFEDGTGNVLLIHEAEEDLEEQRAGEPAHGASNSLRNFGKDMIPLRALQGA